MEMVDYYVAQIEKTAGFQKGDKLYPVVPAVIYWKPDKWNGAKSFDEMFDVSNEAYRRSIPQYDLKLVSPYDLKDEDFSKFHTELGIVLEFIKYSGDKSTLKELVQSEPKYKNLSTNAVQFKKMIHLPKRYYKFKKMNNMNREKAKLLCSLFLFMEGKEWHIQKRKVR